MGIADLVRTDTDMYTWRDLRERKRVQVQDGAECYAYFTKTWTQEVVQPVILSVLP